MQLYVGRQNIAIRPRREWKSYQVFFPSVTAGCEGFEPRDVAKSVQDYTKEIVDMSESEEGSE